jgi:hypothetical protein
MVGVPGVLDRLLLWPTPAVTAARSRDGRRILVTR